MENLKEQAANKLNTQKIAQFLALSSVASLLPFFIHWQWFTGPIVNAIFIIILFLVGQPYALLACFIPSLMALAGGLLPFILLPMIPFIMLGNVIYVTAIDYFYNQVINNKLAYWLSLGLAAILKFVIIFLSGQIILQFVIKKPLAVAITQLISWSQLATAILGGMIAWLFLKWLKRF